MLFNVYIQILIILLSIAALIRKSRQLLALIVGWIINLTLLRRNTCLNCMYYGDTCHLGWGLLTAKLFRRPDQPDVEKMGKRLIPNLIALLLLLGLPVPSMLKNRPLLLTYSALLGVLNIDIIRSCGSCGMKDVCPLGKSMSRLPVQE